MLAAPARSKMYITQTQLYFGILSWFGIIRFLNKTYFENGWYIVNLTLLSWTNENAYFVVQWNVVVFWTLSEMLLDNPISVYTVSTGTKHSERTSRWYFFPESIFLIFRNKTKSRMDLEFGVRRLFYGLIPYAKSA